MSREATDKLAIYKATEIHWERLTDPWKILFSFLPREYCVIGVAPWSGIIAVYSFVKKTL